MINRLTAELTDQIIYGMENQEDFFVLNIETGEVRAEDLSWPDETTSGSSLERIPRWKPADGFQLMERFVDSLNNPVFRERLRGALTGGRGVFRNFKNILKEREDIQRLWFLFKEKEMRTRVQEWFGQICEARGLSLLGMEGEEPEDTDDLVFSDFRVDDAPQEMSEDLDTWDLKAMKEALADSPPEFVYLQYLARRRLTGVDPDSLTVLRLSAPDGETAGIIWGTDAWLSAEVSAVLQADPGVSFIMQLYIEPEYRGLGMSRILLQAYLERSRERGVKRVVLDLWGSIPEGLRHMFIEYGFEMYRESLMLELSASGN